jgi:hypothetical protein
MRVAGKPHDPKPARTRDPHVRERDRVGDRAVLVLVSENYPDSLWRFLLGIVRWEACLLAYLASLVDSYPPFVVETSSVSRAAPSS